MDMIQNYNDQNMEFYDKQISLVVNHGINHHYRLLYPSTLVRFIIVHSIVMEAYHKTNLDMTCSSLPIGGSMFFQVCFIASSHVNDIQLKQVL